MKTSCYYPSMSIKNIIHLVVGPIATNCWITVSGDDIVSVIDPGDEADAIISELKKNSLTPKYILLTHGHFDHIAAVPSLAAAFDPKPQIAIHRLDSQYLGPGAYETQILSAKAALGDTSLIDSSWQNMPEADILLEEGSQIDAFTVLHLPGHTQGSAAFWDKEAGALFTGDTLFKNGYGRTDLPGGSKESLIKSIDRLFKMDPDTAVFPGHDGTTTIGLEC